MNIEFEGKEFEIADIQSNNGVKRKIVELVLHAPSPDRQCELTDFLMCLQAIINEHDNSTATWYLLYDGSSPDGMGRGEYIGRTTDKEEAINHFRKVKNNPYSTGNIRIVTDEEVILALNEKDFEKL